MQPSKPIKGHQTTLLVAGAVTAVGWAIPLIQRILMPLQYLNTHVHEFSHALMTKLTGGEVNYIQVSADTSGVTPVLGGNILLIASAGYVGAAVCGALILLFAGSEKGSRLALRALSLVLVASMILWVRSDAIGVLTGFLWIGLLWGLSFLKQGWVMFAAQFIGIQQCLSSFQSVYTLLQISSLKPETESDALIMANTTHLPPIFWAATWSLLSLSLVFLAIRRAWSRPLPVPGESRSVVG